MMVRHVRRPNSICAVIFIEGLYSTDYMSLSFGIELDVVYGN